MSLVLKTCEECGIVLADPAHPLVEGSDWGGPHSLFEERVFCGLLYAARPQRSFEIGTYWGLRTEDIRHYTAGEVYTLDREAPGTRWARPEQYGPMPAGVKYLTGNSHTVRLPATLYDSVDFIFIDAGHVLADVANDTRLALSLGRPGALLVWHDCLYPGHEIETWRKWENYLKQNLEVAEFLTKHFPGEATQVAGTSLAFYRDKPK